MEFRAKEEKELEEMERAIGLWDEEHERRARLRDAVYESDDSVRMSDSSLPSSPRDSEIAGFENFLEEERRRNRLAELTLNLLNGGGTTGANGAPDSEVPGCSD